MSAYSRMGKRELQQQLYRLYVEEKLSIREIAERWNVSRQTISNQLSKFGIERRSKGKPPVNIQLRMSEVDLRQHLHQLYIQEELTAKEIADQMNVSPNAIQKRLVAFGFERRSKGKRTLFESLGMSEEQLQQQLHCLAEKGLTTQDIADYFNTSYYTISRYLREYGIKPRRKRPVEETGGKYLRCPECGGAFRRKNNRQIYCSYNCRDRRKARGYRKERRRKGLCVTCRKPIADDMPEPAITGRPAVGIHYCRECREYFRRRQL